MWPIFPNVLCLITFCFIYLFDFFILSLWNRQLVLYYVPVLYPVSSRLIGKKKVLWEKIVLQMACCCRHNYFQIFIYLSILFHDFFVIGAIAFVFDIEIKHQDWTSHNIQYGLTWRENIQVSLYKEWKFYSCSYHFI